MDGSLFLVNFDRTPAWHVDAERGPSTPSLDHLVGAGEQHRRHVDAEQLRRLLVEDEFELGRLHDWQIGRFCPLEDSADIDADLTIAVGNARAIAHQAADIDKFAYWVSRGDRVSRRQMD